ncbi:bifunctional phosphoribosyl-AMP cyclohydrolase/phosphoribosyl-ATP diphosphatase HisIE [uncultured Brachyspira sp.]|uniref:bifunctional phosphoribosyl-AMP cyclohydrolase/phosphoribosyl-ATP diphosphatase HisIE n=1 Tax=uncultured Brachyspira sp. TaxID=221953 RepID=UPI0025E4AB77|nr:bifunctional phosphoribosyl-AMP cyclohydrolase/phosphoribosyl-ATP diphosphatase HisIE [uncultured Brachyspira sp.]
MNNNSNNDNIAEKTEEIIEKLKFDDKGLIPAIVTDYYTKEVLTLAYMNKESLEISIKENKTCFYSRSRQELWRKGETSGNYQNIQCIKSDCDNDALIIEVIKEGPACHTGNESCFFNEIYSKEDYKDFSIYQLYDIIKNRKINKTEGSYTTYLFESGIDKILKKVGEECTEVIIGAKNDSSKEIIYEISDLLYHTLVLMAEKNITIDDIKNELSSRSVIDKKEKQKSMK